MAMLNYQRVCFLMGQNVTLGRELLDDDHDDSIVLNVAMRKCAYEHL